MMNRTPPLSLAVVLSLFTVIFLAGTTPMAQETQPEETFIVKEIIISGNTEISEEEILNTLELKTDQETTKAEAENRLTAVKDMGVLKNVDTDLKTSDGQLTLEIEVQEYPVVKEIEFIGTSSLGDQKLKDILSKAGIKTGEPVDRNKVEQGIEDIVKEYEESGYPFVTAGDIDIGETLTVEIIEGKLSSLRIEGLKTVPEEVAINLVEIPKGEVIRLFDLQMTYVNLRGSPYFSNVEVAPARGYKQSDIILRWQLEERTLLEEEREGRRVEIDGNKVFSDGALQDLIRPLPSGKVNNYELLKALKPVYEKYVTSGYVYADLSLTGVENGTFKVEVTEGDIESINIKGNDRTSQKVITNKLNFSVGDPYNSDEAQNSRRRILDLGYFNEVNVEPAKTDEGLVLDLNIKEKTRLNSLNGGLTWSGGGLAGKLTVSTKNLFGIGQDVTLNINRGFSLDSKLGGSLDWKNVYYPSQFNFTKVSLYRDLESEFGSSLSRQGVKASFGFPFTGNLSLNMGYRAEWVSEGDDTDGSLTNIVNSDLVFDDRNNPNFPTSGSRGVLTIEKAGDFAPGVSFTKFKGEWRQYFELPKVNLIEDNTQVIALRSLSEVGFGVPLEYKSYVGGHSTLRGYGGFHTTNYSILNSEYRLELLENDFYITSFVDAGIVLDDIDDPDVLSSAGLELNLQMFGHLRIGAAWALEEDFEWFPTLYFGIGPIF